MDVTVVVGTFGGPEWIQLAQSRAIPSAEKLGLPVIHSHELTLHDARNGGLAQVTTKHVIHLDADDELEPGYAEILSSGDADIRAPAVRYVTGDQPGPAAMPNVWGHRHLCEATCLLQGNWLVVGAMAPADLIREVGGWRDFPWSEDWDVWLRCHLLAAATFQAMPDAVYRAHARWNSRNRGLQQAARLEAHRAIARANGVASP